MSAPHRDQQPGLFQDRLPRQIGPYQIILQLGAGGMGVVYKALHTRLKKVVALKLLPSGRTNDPQAQARFEREMEAVGRLEHPQIVRAMDAGEHQGVHYLAMEYIDGEDLYELVDRRGPLPIAESCEIIRQAAMGLEHAHEQGLVHRDIKPSNLMLSRSGQVKILDLGLARLDPALGELSAELTNRGQPMGTLDYMAPEQAGNSHAVDARADLYSLGATLYKLLCGEAPLSDPLTNGSLSKKLEAIASAAPAPLRERRAEVPMALAECVHCLLAKTPQERLATAVELATALAPFTPGANLRRLGEGAPARSPARAAPLSAVTDAGAARASPPASRRRRSRLAPPMSDDTEMPANTALVVRVAIDRGEIVVTSDLPDVKVVVKRGKTAAEEWEVRRGKNRFTIRSGRYSIEIQGAGEGDLRLSRDRIVIHRGRTELARIERISSCPGPTPGAAEG